ncbi:hypothetical protein ACHAXA_004006 [Cyclostephanos tholiformis]|uniref:Uncharacterized protein n=1 Tax=Cyclostephanos tholiformis TaxID=382380 RepID=A0ABD3RAN0_9STRA
MPSERDFDTYPDAADLLDTMPVYCYKECVAKAAACLTGGAGPCGVEAEMLKHWLLRYVTNACGNTQLCAGLQSGIEANLHAVWTIWPQLAGWTKDGASEEEDDGDPLSDTTLRRRIRAEGTAGKALPNARCLDFLMKFGPSYGYFPEPGKSHYICKAEDKPAARQAFEGFGLKINYLRGQRYLGGFTGSAQKKEEWLGGMVADSLAVVQDNGAWRGGGRAMVEVRRDAWAWCVGGG